MATTKTLTPTNQTITIDAFQGEKPDHRHVADAETKLADAVNALNSQLFTNKADTTLVNLVKTFNVGTYNFRLDNATDAPVTGGVVYKVVKTHGTNDTRCVITALPLAANSPVYSAFVGQNATSISWTQLVTNHQISPSGYSSATRQSTYLSSGSCYYTKIGRIVIAMVCDLAVGTEVPAASALYSNAFFTGLPKTATPGTTCALMQYSTGMSLRLSIVNGSNDAGIAPHYNHVQPSHDQYYGTFWYIAAS